MHVSALPTTDSGAPPLALGLSLSSCSCNGRAFCKCACACERGEWHACMRVCAITHRSQVCQAALHGFQGARDAAELHLDPAAAGVAIASNRRSIAPLPFRMRLLQHPQERELLRGSLGVAVQQRREPRWTHPLESAQTHLIRGSADSSSSAEDGWF